MWILNHLLSIAIFSPLLGVVAICCVPRKFEEGVRQIATAASGLTLAISVVLYRLTSSSSLLSLQERVAWVKELNINYHIGLDGAAALMVGLVALLCFVATIASWNEIRARRKEFYSLLLLTEVGLLGLFSSLDLFLFFIFWEAMLIPMYFLIGMFGSGDRIRVSYKLLLFTSIGSVSLLAAILYIYSILGTFAVSDLASATIAPGVQIAIFAAFAFAFAIKVPLVPLHTWLPDAHTEAPTAGSIILAGAFLKAGLWGFYRIAMPLLPDAVAYFREVLFILATIAIVYGAILALAQTDLKRLIAYSSISHMGFVVIGFASLTAEGVSGGVLQMFNHGVTTGAMFLVFGLIYARTHTRNMAEMGGLSKRIPILSAIFIFCSLASLGLPGLNNFTGEFLALAGTFKVAKIYAVISTSSVIIAAAYILWAIERVFYGTPKDDVAIKDIRTSELFAIAPLLILIVWIGVAPNAVITKIYPSVQNFLSQAKRAIVEPVDQDQNIEIPRIEFKPDIIVPENFPPRKNENAMTIYEPQETAQPEASPETEPGSSGDENNNEAPTQQESEADQ